MHGTASNVTLGTERVALSLNEVAARLGRSKRTIYRLIKQGDIKPVTVGGTWMVLVTEFDDYIERIKGAAA